jgi:hypothetical protein
MGVLIFPCPSFGACQCHYGSNGTKRCLASRRINRQQSTNGQTYRHTQGNALSCTEPMCLIHSGITRHLVVGSAHQELPHRCASCKNSAASRANTGSVPPTATRSCMPPSAFLQPCTFCRVVATTELRERRRRLSTKRHVPLTGHIISSK